MDCIIKQLVNVRKDLTRPIIKPYVSLTDPHKVAIRQSNAVPALLSILHQFL